MSDNHPSHIDHILLFCTSPEYAREFYEKTLNFKIDHVEGDVTYLHLGETKLMLYPIGGDKSWLADESTLGRGVRIYFSIPDVDALAKHVQSTGTRIYNHDDNSIIKEPITRAWGIREFGIVDPDGYRLYFAMRVEK